MAGKNLLVNGKNNITARANAMANIQNTMANRTTASNVNATPNLPTRPTTVNLQKAQQPVQTKLNNVNQTLPTNNTPIIQANTGVGAMAQTPTQPSRFVGFQQRQGQTMPQWRSPTFVQTDAQRAELENRENQQLNKENENLIRQLHRAIKNNNGPLTANQISKQFKEWKGKENKVLELENEIRPLIQQGQYGNMSDIQKYYPELLQTKALKNIEEVKAKSELANTNFQQLNKRVDTALKSNWNTFSANGMKYLQDFNILSNAVEQAKKQYRVVGGANDFEIMKELVNQNPELQKIFKEWTSLELSDLDKAKLGRADAKLLSSIGAETMNSIRNDLGLVADEQVSNEELEIGIRAREKLEAGFGKQTWKKVATEIGVPLDSLEKFVYRTYKDVQNKIYANATESFKNVLPKSFFEKGLGIKLSDDQYNSLVNMYDTITKPGIEEEIKKNQQYVMDYTESVNKDYENRKARNLDPDIEQFYNNRGMTSMLLNGDIKGFAYKAAGETAQNIEMPLIIAAGAVAPEIVLPLMATDSYARESQESFEELMKAQQEQGISQDQAYQNAQEGAAIVGAASSAVELVLEKVLGGVETTASKAFHDALMKDFTKKATEMVAERGLVDILKQGAVTQFRSSLEEGLEEVVQQAIHNASVKKYDPDQKITEGMLEAFEGGFFNPMNLLAGGGEVYGGIQQNSENIKQTFNNNLDNIKNVTNKVTTNVSNTAKEGYNKAKNLANRIEIAPGKVGDVYENMRNKVTSQGGINNNQGQEEQRTLNTTSQNQNNINGDNYNQKTKNSKTLNKFQLGMLQGDNRMNPTKITEFKEKFGKDYGQALADMGYTESQETNVPKIEEDTKEIYNEKKKAMNSVQGEFQDRSLADMLEIMLQKAKNTKDYDMIDKYERLTEKHNTKGLTMAEANDMREEFTYKIKTKRGQENNSDKIDLADNVYLAVKKFLEKTAEANGIKDLQKMNREIAMRKYLSTWIGDKAERQSANNIVSLTDWVILAEAASNPYAAAGFAAKKIMQTPTVKNAVLNAVVGRRENRAIDKQNRQAANKERMDRIESANEGKKLQEQLSIPETPALPNGIRLTKVTEINNPKNKVTSKKKTTKTQTKKSDSNNDDTTPPSGGTPTGTNPTNNQGGATDDTKTKKQPKKKAETKTKTTSKKSAVTDYINETPQNERGQMEEIEAEENLRNNETPQNTVDQIINEEQYLIDTKKYNPRNKNVAERKIKHETPKEKDIWTDSNGEEVTFYHGTPQGGFEEFSMDFRGKSNDRVGNGDYGRGMYFTPYKETAEGYAKSSKAESTNPEIYETKLRMENPLRLDLYKEFQRAMNKLAKEDTKRGYSLLSKEHSENIDRLMKEFGLTEELYDKYEDIISSLGDNRFDVDIRGSGFDGIISEDGKEVIVPNTDQIIIQRHYSTNETTQKLKNKVTAKNTKATQPKAENKIENPKKKLTKKEEKEARARGIAVPNGVLIYTNSEFKYIPSLQQGLIRLTKEEGEAKFKEQLDDALENGLEMTVLTDEQTGETIAYNPYRTNDQIRDIQEARDEKPYDAVTTEVINGEDVEDYEIKDGNIWFNLDPEKSNGSHTVIVDLQDFLNYSFLKDYVKGEKNNGTLTAKNKITNNANALWDTFEDIDKDTLKILADMGDKAAIKLYEEEGGIQNMLAEEMYNEESAPDLALEEMYKEQLIEENETQQRPSLFEEDLIESNLKALDENETPQRVDVDEGVDISTQLVDEFNNLKTGEFKWIGDGYKAGVRKTFSDSNIKIPGDQESIEINFTPLDSGERMNINLFDTSKAGIRNTNEVLTKLDIPYRIGSEFDEELNETRYFLENKLTHTKAYFDKDGTSWLKVNKPLRNIEITPRRNAEQQAEYNRQIEQRRAEIEAEREQDRIKTEERKAEEERQQEIENQKKANLLRYIDIKYNDSPLGRGRTLKDLSEINDESNNKVQYYGDDVADDAEVWQVLDAMADKGGKIREVWESDSKSSYSYEYYDEELGRNRNIQHLNKTQRDYLEYRIKASQTEKRVQNYLNKLDNNSLKTRAENKLNDLKKRQDDNGKTQYGTDAQYIDYLVLDKGFTPKEFPTGKTYPNGEPKVDYMIVNEKNVGYISSKIENDYAKSLLETPEEEISKEDEEKLEKELFNKKSDNSDYESRIIKDNSNYKFEDLKDADIETILSKDGFEKYTFEEDGQKGEGYAGYINGKAVDIIPNKEKNRITINVGDELFRSYDDGSINVQLNGSDEITQTSSVYDNEVFKGTLARALGTEYKALGEPKSYKYDKDNGVFAIYDKSDSDKIVYEVSLGDKVMFDDGTIYDTSKHLGAGRTQGGEKHFDNKPVTEIFAGKTLIGISKGNKYASNKYTDTRAQGAVLKDMKSIQELEWLLEDKNNILVGEIEGTPVKVSALDLNYNPIKMENVGKEDDYYNKVKTYKLQVGKNTDNTYFYDTFPELKSALKRIYVGEDVNKTTTEITGEKNAVTAKQVENEKPKNLVTSRIENTNQEIQVIDKDKYYDDIARNAKKHPREMFIYQDGRYFYPKYILPSGQVISPENTYWGEVGSEEAAREWLKREAEEYSEENEAKKTAKLQEMIGKTAEKYEQTLKRIESDNPMQEIWTSGDYFKYGMGDRQMAKAKKEAEVNAEVGTFKKDVIDGKEGYRLFIASTKKDGIWAFYEPKTGKIYKIYKGPQLDDSRPYTTSQVDRIEKFLGNVEKQLDKETKKEKVEEKDVITQEWLDSLKPDENGVVELDPKGGERYALAHGKGTLVKEGKADGKYLYNYATESRPQYRTIYIKDGKVYDSMKGINGESMTTKQDAIDWLNEKEKDVAHEGTPRYEKTDYETLPKTVSVESEAEKAGPKRIAPDRVKWQQETYDKGLENVKDVIKAKRIVVSDLGFKSLRGKAINDIWEEIQRIRRLPESEAESQYTELARSIYEDLVIKDISKGYRYPEDVTSRFPEAQMKKAIDARARYEKGLFTSFSSKDTRANNQYRDEIGAGIKSQDGKPVTQEQMNEIVDGIRAYKEIFGIDMKKFAEDNNIIYVHLHGGNPFLMGGMNIGGLYRRGADGNISVSLGGKEGVMEKGEDGEMKKTDIKTTTSHELTHAVDGMLGGKLFSDADITILKKTMNEPTHLINYYNRPHEIVARAVEQYAAHKIGKNYYRTVIKNIDMNKGSVEFADKEYNYVDREGYWDQDKFDRYVKPIVEKNMNEKLKDYKIEQPKNNVLSNGKNNVTSGKTQAARSYSPRIVMRLDENGNPIKKKTKNLVGNGKNKVTTNAEAIWNPVIKKEVKDTSIDDLDDELRSKVGLDYEITDGNDPIIHGLLDYIIKKKGLNPNGKGMISKIVAINEKLPKASKGDDMSKMSPIDQLGYDVKDMISYWKAKKNNDYLIDGGEGGKTYVPLKVGDQSFRPHMSKELYDRLKAEGYLVSKNKYYWLKRHGGIKRK